MKQTDKSIIGTTFQLLTLFASVEQLKKVLGKPTFEHNNGKDKTNFEWNLETDDGNVFAIYDWKEYRPLQANKVIEWYIGANSEFAALQGYTEIKEAIENLNN